MRLRDGPGRCLLLLLSAATAVCVRLRTPAAQPEPDLSTVHVAYTGDAGSFTGLLGSLISLSRSLARPQDCHVHLFVPKEAAAGAVELGECLRRELGPSQAAPALEVHGMESGAIPFDPNNSILPNHLRGKKAVFFRNYIADLLPEVDRVLYLDTDTVVKGDVAPLYRMPMEHAIACVHEGAPLERYLASPGGKQARPYVPNATLPFLNIGVMLLDLRKWRSEGIARVLEAWPEKLGVDNDQLAITLEFHFHRGHDLLDKAWNVYGLSQLNAFERWVTSTPNWTPAQLAEARILHFSGIKKPWGERPKDPKAAMYQDLYAPYAPRQHCGVLRNTAR